MPIVVRPVRDPDRPEWVRMRRLLWPDCPEPDHRAETEAYLRGPDRAVFVAEREGGGLGGFVEAGLRPAADGYGPGPVGYVEGWYVDADLRRRGVGRQLLRAAEDWARGRGCTEMASDADIDNTVSRAAHARLGYDEVDRLAHFRKPLGVGSPGRGVAGPLCPVPPPRTFDLVLLIRTFTVCRLGPDEPFPDWASSGAFACLTRTPDELSVVCPEDVIPEGVRCERDWRCLRVAGTLDFALVGVLASLLQPLAGAGVAVFVLSTFDTDYLLVREADLGRAVVVLREAGHTVAEPGPQQGGAG
jgi:aminoglycoside 6'-N-acetyltransferase I